MGAANMPVRKEAGLTAWVEGNQTRHRTMRVAFDLVVTIGLVTQLCQRALGSKELHFWFLFWVTEP